MIICANNKYFKSKSKPKYILTRFDKNQHQRMVKTSQFRRAQNSKHSRVTHKYSSSSGTIRNSQHSSNSYMLKRQADLDFDIYT